MTVGVYIERAIARITCLRCGVIYFVKQTTFERNMNRRSSATRNCLDCRRYLRAQSKW